MRVSACEPLVVGPSFPVTAIGLRAQPVSNRKSSNATQATRVMVIMPSFQQLEQLGEIDRLVDEPEESGELLHKRSQFFSFLITALTFFVAFSHLGDLVLRPGRRRGSRREAHQSHASKALLAPPDTTSSGSVRLKMIGGQAASVERPGCWDLGRSSSSLVPRWGLLPLRGRRHVLSWPKGHESDTAVARI